MSGPLEGIRILDLTRVLAGPFSTMILGDLGAEVIKIETPRIGDDTRQWGPPFIAGESAYFLSVNRNKRSMTLDLKKNEGRKILYELAERCDVLIENFRPGVTDRLEVDYPRLSRMNPRLIYCSITSFGPSGPYRDMPVYDLVVQGMGGIMGITGEAGQPPIRVGVAVSDIAGAMYATIAILAALSYRQQTGKGQFIDISLLDSTISWMTYMAGYYFATGQDPAKMGSAHPTIVPYQCFETKDGEFVTIAIGNDKLFLEFCEAIGLKKQLASDERFASNARRVLNRNELIPILEKQLKTRTRQEWLSLFAEKKLPAGPVYSMHEIFAEEQVALREMLVKIHHPTAGEIKQIGIPMKFSDTRTRSLEPPPLLGQQTDDILKSILRYDTQRIAELHENRIV
jgi:crotonobetainyl-CoA:carnitine CoA-transferase CaiB-like acyl-CoA transferase